MGQLAQVLDHLGAQIDNLQVMYTQSDVGMTMVDERLADLSTSLAKLAARLDSEAGQTAVLTRIAEGQERLIEALTGEAGGPHIDAESRMRLRSIDVQLLRILEEISAGRQETMADLRGDLSALTQAVRQLLRART